MMNFGVTKLGSPISSRIASGSLFAASKTSRIDDRRASSALRAIGGVPTLDVAMALEARPRRVAVAHLSAHAALGANDLLCFLEHVDGLGSGDDKDPVELAEDDVARIDQDAADRDRLLRCSHLPPADAVQRREVAVEDLVTDLAQSLDVAQVAVEDRAYAAVCTRGIGRQLSEVPDAAAWSGRHEKRVRCELFEHLEVGAHADDPLVPADVGNVVPFDGERLPDDSLFREEWPEPGG